MRWLQVEATGRESGLRLPITSMVIATPGGKGRGAESANKFKWTDGQTALTGHSAGAVHRGWECCTAGGKIEQLLTLSVGHVTHHSPEHPEEEEEGGRREGGGREEEKQLTTEVASSEGSLKILEGFFFLLSQHPLDSLFKSVTDPPGAPVGVVEPDDGLESGEGDVS